jgi:PAS domain-containing protein
MQAILFIYGLAFFSLALTICLRYDNRSTLKLAKILWYLVGFGFLHGLNEWLDLWALSPSVPSYIQPAGPYLLLSSFLLLFEFGRRLLLDSLVGQPSGRLASLVLSLWVYAPILTMLGIVVSQSQQYTHALTIWSRYLPGFLGSSMAAVGIYLFPRNRLGQEDPSEGAAHQLAWSLAALSFLIYGISAGLVTESSNQFPASVLNADGFLRTFGFPIQLVRALCAVGLAASVGRLLRVFHQEYEEKLRNEVRRNCVALDMYYDAKGRFEAILQASPQGLIGLDQNGLVEFANDIALGLLDYQMSTLKGLSFHLKCHHTDRDGQVRLIDHWVGYEGLPLNKIERIDKDHFWRANGKWFTVSYQVTPQWRNRRTRGVVISFTPLA